MQKQLRKQWGQGRGGGPLILAAAEVNDLVTLLLQIYPVSWVVPPWLLFGPRYLQLKMLKVNTPELGGRQFRKGEGARSKDPRTWARCMEKP